MSDEALALIMLLTAGLHERGWRYLAEEPRDGEIVVRLFRGLDES